MVGVFAALPRKGSQEVAEHSLVIVLRLAFVAVILTRVVGGGGGGVFWGLGGGGGGGWWWTLIRGGP